MEAIHDHAIIGDCRSAALVTPTGRIDWLCWPRFDSPAVFSAILDDRAGHWQFAPKGPFRSERAYVEGTNVLRTTFHTPTGTLVLTDLMPVASEAEKRRVWVPDHEILRVAECTSGEVEVEMIYAPRPGFGRQPLRLRNAGKLGLRLQTKEGLLTLRTDVELLLSEGEACGTKRLRAGEVAHASLTFASEWQAVLPPLGAWSNEVIARSIAWWCSWSGRLTYEGPRRDAVLRSALALKLLVYAPSGAVVAAPTTSLPERVGGDLNWDYRFCWLRDASLTVRALFGLGFAQEAETFVSWLLHSTSLTQPELRVLYDVYGNQPAPERTLGNLFGYRGSKPVRVGNEASHQLQLDVYGEVIDATVQSVRHGGTLDAETRRMLTSFGDYVCRNWQRADEGIWEPRSGRRHNTHSRVLCWVALQRLLELYEKGHLGSVPAARWAHNRDMIRTEVEARAWNPLRRSYVAALGGDDLDASTLLLSWYGFAPASSERMRLTYERIREELGTGGGLLLRYRTGESPGEGAFGICSFWGAEFLALGGGSAQEAEVEFQRVCGYANDVGLFAEEMDPATGEGIGNFPQAFTHVGLINAAISLCMRLRGEEPLVRQVPPCRPQHVEAHP